MKNILVIILLLLILSCVESNNDTYTKLEFKRLGGGSKEFFISKNDLQNLIQINITKYNFKDTTLIISLTPADINENIFTTLKLLLNGQINIEGDFKQPTLPTGTWAYFYMIDKNSNSKEITNAQLREQLLQLENAVENKMKINY